MMPWKPSAAALLDLPRGSKRLLALLMDGFLCALTVWVALCLRLETWVVVQGNQWWAMALSLALALPLFVIFGLYRAIFRYAGWAALAAVARAVTLYGIIYAGALVIWAPVGVPRTLGMLQPPLLLLAVGGSRALARYWLSGLYLTQLQLNALPKVLIYGAGAAGRQLAAALSSSKELRAVGFLDDDPGLHGQVLSGLPILNPQQLPQHVQRLSVSDILLAVPSMGRHRRNEILDLIRHTRVSVRTLPGMLDLAQGRVQVSDLRELDIEDLLGREAVPPDQALLEQNLRGKVVLVTGAGGSIGSELCRQIVRCQPRQLLLLDASEFALYTIHQELERVLAAMPTPTATQLRPLLASVQDEPRMHEVLQAFRPHTVYHAAAYKHVPLVEQNPGEGLANNVLGTLVAASAAAAAEVANFVLISTDKAVRPTNIMGASKRAAEMVLQALAMQGGSTCFSMVRFGNVLGSSGSVVPLFRQQIKSGGPITLTHADVTRYFMTIPEAAQLVIQAGAMAHGGEVFVLDMGEPVRITDLARRMVELSGLTVQDDHNPDGDIALEITGLRPGEKLYEELLIGDDPQPTQHARIMKAHESCRTWQQMQEWLANLRSALQRNDVQAMRALLLELVQGYQPADEIVDWLHLQRQS